MGLFDGIKKSRIIKKILSHSYLDAEEANSKIENLMDEELAEALIKNYDDAYKVVDEHNFINYINNDYNLLLKIPFDFFVSLCEIDFSLINTIPTNYIRILLDKAESLDYAIIKLYDLNHSILDLLGEDEIVKILPNILKYDALRKDCINRLSDECQISLLSEKESNSLFKYITDFRLNVVGKGIESYINNNCNIESLGHNYYEEISQKLNFSELPVEYQLEIAKYCPSLTESFSDEASKAFIGTNPYLFSLYGNENFENLSKNDMCYFVREFNSKNYENLHQLGIRANKNAILKYHSSFQIEIAMEEFKNIFINHPAEMIEMARFDPEIFSYPFVCEYEDQYKEWVDYYKECIKNLPNAKEIENYIISFIDGEHSMDTREKINILKAFTKVLLNETIIKNCQPDLILNFIKAPHNSNLLKEIVRQAYGDKALIILQDRPNITVDEIMNFDIFNENIINNFGEGLVHNLLSYNSEISLIVAEMGRHPELIDRFKQFEKITDRLFDDTNMSVEKKFRIFYDLDRILNERIFELTEKEKVNLRTYINDSYYANGYSQVGLTCLEKVEDLDDYNEKRIKNFDELIEKVNSPKISKIAILGRFFGLIGLDSANFINSSLNLKKFVNDERTLNNPDFDSNELDMLELVSIIISIDDNDTLKDMYNMLKEKDNILTPIDFESLIGKVKNTYNKSLINSLTTNEELINKAKNGEKVNYYEEDGVPIIELNGADFMMMMSTLGMNNSRVQLYESTNRDNWYNYEKGVSSISCCLIDQGMLSSCADENTISFGFSETRPDEVIGMGPTDIQITHSIRKMSPHFDYGVLVEYEYPEELIRRTAAQIEGILGESRDQWHPYNEVSIYRREIVSTRIKNGTSGGRKHPSEIIIYGRDKLSEAKRLAKDFAINGKPIPIRVINLNSYHVSSFDRAMKGYVENRPTRPKSQFMQEVSDIVETGGKSR